MAVAYEKEEFKGPPIPDKLYKSIHLRNIHKMKSMLPKIVDINEKIYFGVAPLLYAIEQEDNDEMLELLLQQPNIDPFSTDNEGNNALHLLAFKGQYKWVKIICERFSDVPVDQLSFWGNTPLLEAAKMAHIEIIEYLQQKGANIHHRNKNQITALHYVVIHGNLEACRRLIELGVDVNARDDRGYTPLMYSIYWKYPEISKLILANDADVGHTAIQLAARSSNSEIVKLLSKHGAKMGHEHSQSFFNDEEEKKWLIGSLFEFIKQKNLHNLQILLPQVKDINAKNERGYSPLVLAAKQENNDDLLLLLFQLPGIDPLSSNDEKKNALHLFALKGQLDWIHKFFQRFHDMPVDELNDWENTPLMEAARMGHTEIIEYLHQRGADIHHKNIKQITALQYAAGNGHLEATRRLIELGANINATGDRGYTPLMDSVSWNYPETCKELIAAGANVNIHGPRGHTALYFAALMGNVEIVELLLEHGANPEGADVLTPLNAAVLKGNVDVIKTLIRYKAKIDAPGIGGKNALSLATRHSFLNIAKILLENGADPNLLTNTKFPITPVAAACLNGDLELLRELLKHGGDVNYAKTHCQPLFNCIKTDFYEGAVEVINAGANLRGKQSYNSPLEYCRKLKRDRIAELIRKHL